MQQELYQQELNAPARGTSDTHKRIEDLLSILRILKRGWRFIAVAIAICLTLAIISIARTRPIYQASARLLVLQQGGRPLNVSSAGGGEVLQTMQGPNDSLTTHIMIIRSPAIVDRALTTAGLRGLQAESVIDRLSIKLTEPGARVLQVDYKAETRDEALRLTRAVILTYDKFLQENYQKNSNNIISLISEARDQLSQDLKKLEREYLEYRQRNPAYTADEHGRTFVARRLDQVDQTATQALVRTLQLRSQLELGRKLSVEGAGPDAVVQALGQLGGLTGDANVGVIRSATDIAPGLPHERIEVELGEVQFERLTTERLLEHLRADRLGLASSPKFDDRDVSEAFNAEPAVAEIQAELRRARTRHEQAKRLVRSAHDPAVTAAERNARGLQAELDRLWQRRRPAILARMGPISDDAIHKVEAGLMMLTAKEAALRERLGQVKADRSRQLRREYERMVKLHGPGDSKVGHLQEQIARLEGKADDSDGQARTRSLLGTIEQSLESIEAMRTKLRERFESDLDESKKAEIGLLAESNLRHNLERQRTLFNSVVDQLKQAQLVSDFGSVTAQTINPPSVKEIRPQAALILIAALLVGGGLGGGAAFVVDLLDARLRSVSEIRRVLDLNVLGMIPLLPVEQDRASCPVGLISEARPRSPLSEAYRSIRTNVESLRRSHEARVLLITSPQPGDGKSTTASNLAISLAHAGRKVLLIDGDLRRPSQHKIYNLRRDRGLVHILKDRLPLDRAVQPTSVANLDLIASGPEVQNPAELLASPRLGEFLDEARRIYDVVIFDSSPLLAVTDASIIAATVDRIILVALASSTRRQDAEQTLELLNCLGTPVLGVVINGVTREMIGYGNSYLNGYYSDSGLAREIEDRQSPRRPC